MIGTVVVDDEPSALDRYSGYIEDYGRPFGMLAGCARAREAFETIVKREAELVLTDIRMPGEDGLSLLGRLRDSGWKGQVVVISGYDDFSYAQKAIRLGVFDFLLKPVFAEDIKSLLDKIAALFSSGAAWRGSASRRSLNDSFMFRDVFGLPEAVKKAIAFIETRYDSHFTIEEAAASACVSPAWLSACFKRSVGMSVKQYARLKRTEKACRLLSGSDAPLKEIAETLAFPDLPTFAKMFRKLIGTSPAAWRRAARVERIAERGQGVGFPESGG